MQSRFTNEGLEREPVIPFSSNGTIALRVAGYRSCAAFTGSFEVIDGGCFDQYARNRQIKVRAKLKPPGTSKDPHQRATMNSFADIFFCRRKTLIT